MSFQGAVRKRMTAGGMVAMGVIALSPLLFDHQVFAQDSDSSRPVKEVIPPDVPSEPIPNPTLREGSSEKSDGKAVNETVAGITKDVKSVPKVKAAAAKKPVNRATNRKTAKLKLARRGNYPSRGYFSGRRIITMNATAYTADPAENGGNRSGRTAIGLKIGHGVVAVDPRVIPLGTRLFIEGYGHAVAADTGGAIKGHKIDLGCDTKRQMRKIGRRRVNVHILD